MNYKIGISMDVKLTQYSHSSGCGCKIAPQVLEEILLSSIERPDNNKLIVGNSTRDDAAVYLLDKDTALISTTDFFMPIVDDAFDFGRIAAANAISDIYAMGGQPILALAILGWPVNKLPTALAQRVMEGARSICAEAGIPIAGGHSIDALEPMFGLSVNGMVKLANLKQNSTAREGDWLYLTKRIGAGLFSTATKRGVLKEEHKGLAEKQMTLLNKIGSQFGKLKGVHAMTDITGFGLLGHLTEMGESSDLSAELAYDKVLLMDGLTTYISQMCIPDNTYRNWNAYEKKTEGITGDSLFTLCDPQTNGGLLIAVDSDSRAEVEILLQKNGLGEHSNPIGKMIKKKEKVVYVK